MRKKKQITFTIDENIYMNFNNISKKTSLNKSLFVENCLLDYIKKHSKQDDNN
jgi:metal-responsive CopG/Arc/MetJ family transcriptional regulator